MTIRSELRAKAPPLSPSPSARDQADTINGGWSHGERDRTGGRRTRSTGPATHSSAPQALLCFSIGRVFSL